MNNDCGARINKNLTKSFLKKFIFIFGTKSPNTWLFQEIRKLVFYFFNQNSNVYTQKHIFQPTTESTHRIWSISEESWRHKKIRSLLEWIRHVNNQHGVEWAREYCSFCVLRGNTCARAINNYVFFHFFFILF